MASIEELLQHHREEDDKRFNALAETLKKIDGNVESLLQSRSFFRGAMWLAGGIGGVVAFLVSFLKH